MCQLANAEKAHTAATLTLLCLLPVHDQCKNQVTRSPTVLSDTNFEDSAKGILKQLLCVPIYAGNSQNKILSTTSKNHLVLKPESTLVTISSSSCLGTHALPQGVLSWPERQQMKQPAGTASLCWVQTSLSRLKAVYAIMHLLGHAALH